MKNILILIIPLLLLGSAIIAGITYTINTGTVTDNTTGLIWTQCGLAATGQPNGEANCAGDEANFTWSDAINACEALDFNGITDWRLPNIRELSSITTHYQLRSPQINSTAFPGTEGEYWSSTLHINDANYAWLVWANFGVTAWRDRTLAKHVRCVAGP